MSIKSHNFVENEQIWPIFNPNLDLVGINLYKNFDQNPFISSQDIEWKQNFYIRQQLLLTKGHESIIVEN